MCDLQVLTRTRIYEVLSQEMKQENVGYVVRAQSSLSYPFLSIRDNGPGESPWKRRRQRQRP